MRRRPGYRISQLHSAWVPSKSSAEFASGSGAQAHFVGLHGREANCLIVIFDPVHLARASQTRTLSVVLHAGIRRVACFASWEHSQLCRNESHRLGVLLVARDHMP